MLPGLLELFDPVGVFEGVESIFGAAAVGRYVSYHHRSAVASERVFQHHCQLASSEGCVILVLVQCSNTLLQSQQAFIDLGPVYSCLLLALIGVVCSSLAASQVDERYFSMELVLSFEADLEDGVRA